MLVAEPVLRIDPKLGGVILEPVRVFQQSFGAAIPLLRFISQFRGAVIG